MKLKYDSWDKISVKMYRQLADIDKTDDEPMAKNMATLALLMGMTEDEAWNIPMDEAKSLFSSMGFLKEFKMPEKMKNKYVLGGTEYKTELDLNKFTISQYIDFEQYSKGGISPEKMPEILSCFLVPKGKIYGKDYSLDDTIKAIDEELSFPDAQCICFFFLNSLRTSMRAIALFSKWTMKKLTRKMPKAERERRLKELEDLMKAEERALFTFL